MTTHRLIDDLDADLDQALGEIARTSGVRAKSLALYDLTKALSKAGLGEEVATVVAETRKFIGEIELDRSDDRTESYANVCRALAITETAEEVTRLVEDFPRVTRNQWNDTDSGGVFLALCESVLDDVDDLEKALALIRGIADGEQRDYAYGHVCKAYARLGRANDALELAPKIGDQDPFNKKSYCLAECAEALIRVGAAEDALDVAGQIPADRCRSAALFAVAQSLAGLGRGDEARTVLEQAQAIPGELRSEREFALVRTSAILATLGDFDEALAVANQIGPERPRYSQAVANLCREMASRGDLDEARSLASKVENRDVVALGIVKGLTSVGRLQEAEDILIRIKDEEQAFEGWDTLGRKLSSESHTSEVMRIAERLPGYKGDDIVRSLVESLAKEGRFQDAVAIVAERWSTSPISRIEALGVIYHGARTGTPQLIDAGQLEVENYGEQAAIARSDNVADAGQHTSKEAGKKGFFGRLFG